MNARVHSIYSSHTCSRASNTQCHTHTKSYQVIHQLTGTKYVQILRETARAEKAEPAPASQLYHSARPAPPRIFCHILARSPPRSADTSPRRHAAQPAPHWCGPQPATPRNKKNPARGGTRATGPRGLRAETRPAQCLVFFYL